MCNQITIEGVRNFICNITGDVPYRYSATEVQNSIIFHKLLDYLKKQNKDTLAQEAYDLWKDIDFQGFPYRMINPNAEGEDLHYQSRLTRARLSILYLNIALSLFLVQKYPNIFEKLSENSKTFYSKLVKRILNESYKNNPPLLALRNFNADYINFRHFSRGSPKFLVDVNQEWLLQILDCNTEEVLKENYLYADPLLHDGNRLNKIPNNKRLALSSQYVNIPNNSSYKDLSSGFKTSFIVGFEFIDQIQDFFKNSPEFLEIDNDDFFADFLKFITQPATFSNLIVGKNPDNINKKLNNMLNIENLDIPEIAIEAAKKAMHQTKLLTIQGTYAARKKDVMPILEEQPCTNDVLMQPYTLSLRRYFHEFVQSRQDDTKEYQNQFIVNFKHLLEIEIPNINLDNIEWLSLYIIVKRDGSWEMLDYIEVDDWINKDSSEEDYFYSPRLIIMEENNSSLIKNINLGSRVGLALNYFPYCIYAVLAIDVS